MKRKLTILIFTSILFPVLVSGQRSRLDTEQYDTLKTFIASDKHDVIRYEHNYTITDTPRNIILMIGDGMGVSHVFAGLVANGGKLFIENFKHVGFSKTHSATRFVTDSGAGGTALATGHKTYNSAISMVVNADGDTIPVKTVLELADEKGMATGIVASCAMSHATPGSFIAHQPSRSKYDAIALDYLKTDIDVFIGGGSKNFNDRADKQNLVKALEERGYKVLHKMDEIAQIKEGKLAGLTAYAQNDPVPKRDLDLAISTETAMNILDKSPEGFFLMVEASQIDWGSHEGNTTYVVREMLDFDKAIGKVLEFASKNKETLVIVTADHETGGFAVVDGDYDEGIVHGQFITGNHTGVMVPVFAYGPGADKFTGIIDNTDIAKNIMSILENKSTYSSIDTK